MKKILAAFFLLSATSALAAGPESVGFSNRTLWPEAINSPSAFDKASRAEIIVFAEMLFDTSRQSAAELKTAYRINQADLASVTEISRTLASRLMENWNKAAKTCTPTEAFCPDIHEFSDLVTAAKALSANLPDSYRAWHENTRAFHKNYANELIRLAALFPAVSSEISTFSSREKNGFELPDRQFLLTFDDGPTDKGGNTDKLLPLLNKNGVHASFYVLGERLKARQKQTLVPELRESFRGQCVAMHGWQHQSHAKWANWQQSIMDTRDLVNATFPDQYRPWFRPPYGQRKSDSADFFQKNNLGVALWNIDSQDWNGHVNGDAAAQRVFTLMLLWRHGVILFHDIHPKALVAVPWLLEKTRDSGVEWVDCYTY